MLLWNINEWVKCTANSCPSLSYPSLEMWQDCFAKYPTFNLGFIVKIGRYQWWQHLPPPHLITSDGSITWSGGRGCYRVPISPYYPISKMTCHVHKEGGSGWILHSAPCQPLTRLAEKITLWCWGLDWSWLIQFGMTNNCPPFLIDASLLLFFYGSLKVVDFDYSEKMWENRHCVIEWG